MEKDEEENNNSKSLPLSFISAPTQTDDNQTAEHFQDSQDKLLDSSFLESNGTNFSSSSSFNFGSNQPSYHYVDSRNKYLSSSNSLVLKNYARDFDSVVRIGGSPPPSPPPPKIKNFYKQIKFESLETNKFFNKFNKFNFPIDNALEITNKYLDEKSSHINFNGIYGWPKEITIHILSFLTGPDLGRMSQVTKEFRRLIGFEPLLKQIVWSHLIEQEKTYLSTTHEEIIFLKFIRVRYGVYEQETFNKIYGLAKEKLAKKINKESIEGNYRRDIIIVPDILKYYIFPKLNLESFKLPEYTKLNSESLKVHEYPRLDLESFKVAEYLKFNFESLIIRIASTDKTEKMDDQAENTVSTDQIENDDQVEKTDDTNLND